MSTEVPNTTNNSQSNLSKPLKTLIGSILAIVILIAGYFGYQEFFQKPDQEKAAAALFYPEHWFEMDSLNYVLNGDGQNQGVLTIINKYGGTPSGNIAKMYAGMAYLRMGDFDNAIKYLEQFDGKKTPVAYSVFGSLGDAFMEKGDLNKGVGYYKKAAESKDDVIAPMYLYRAAKAYEVNNKAEEAIVIYKQIRTEYPFSQAARDADRNLGTLGNTDIN